ncbi:hypothetical protein Tco_0877737 [Tanacetum coccineum]|uniref:Uncharacterized protein n=1 Tax=Tanacetum coccineum TaxID=301880 RepID=A0ABQ5BWA0_9ASTR
MSDSEDSTVTYTEISSPYEDLSDIGSPGAEGPIFQDPPSPDYVLSPEETKSRHTFSYLCYHLVSERWFTQSFLPEDDEITRKDPEEGPTDYPADRGRRHGYEEPSYDDDDDEDECIVKRTHSTYRPGQLFAYSADQDPYLAYRVTARMSIRPQAPAPFLSEEVAERLLALPTPPPSPLSPYSSPLPQISSPPLPIPSPPPNGTTYVEGSLGSRAAGIRQRDALPSPVHETEMPEICLLFRESVSYTPVLDTGSGECPPDARRLEELGYGITDTWDDLEMISIILSWIDDNMIRALHRARVNIIVQDDAHSIDALPNSAGVVNAR